MRVEGKPVIYFTRKEFLTILKFTELITEEEPFINYSYDDICELIDTISSMSEKDTEAESIGCKIVVED